MHEERARRLLEAEALRLGWVRAVEEERRADEAEGGIFAELSSADQHQADSASETFQEELEQTIVVMEDERLADVRHALGRLDAGTYGTCETCHDVIPDERLEAEPAARFCITHQRAWELRQIDLSTAVLPGPDPSGNPLPATLDGLPTDDDLGEALEVSAEEAAVHVEDRATGMTPAEAERMLADEPS